MVFSFPLIIDLLMKLNSVANKNYSQSSSKHPKCTPNCIILNAVSVSIMPYQICVHVVTLHSHAIQCMKSLTF